VDTQIDDYLSRPGRYENIDGLIEVSWGAMLLGFGFWQWMASITPRGSFFHHWYSLIGFAAVLAAGLHSGRLFVKRHVTYTRTGFAVPRRCAVSWQALVIVGGVAGATSSAVMTLLKHSGNTSEAMLLWVASAMFYALVERLDQQWKAVVLLAMTLGLLAIVLTTPDQQTMERCFLLLYGLCWVASGATTFALYLRHSRPAEAAE